MGKKVFISYCHDQKEWILNRLSPCLKYGGSEILIDQERFKAGKAVIGQMDATQDKADIHLLVLSPKYLSSSYCQHEMDRAIAKDPLFQQGTVIPVLREPCNLPNQITLHNPIYINLTDDKNSQQWDRLLTACHTRLGISAADWLHSRDEIIRYLHRNESVNLVISGHPKWQKLIQHIKDDHFPDIGIVDLESGATASRRGLVEEILKACCSPTNVPSGDDDLVKLNRILNQRRISRLAIEHFDMVTHRPNYGVDLFAALRNLIMTCHKLILLVQSRIPFSALLPQNHPLSSLELKVVELRG